MRKRQFKQDRRSVSEIYGTVLIISMAFTMALLLFGGGVFVVNELTEEAGSSVGEDTTKTIDRELNELAAGEQSTQQTTTFEIPSKEGVDFQAQKNEGKFKITVKVDKKDHYMRTEAYKKRTNGADDGKSSPPAKYQDNNEFANPGKRTLTLGTIRHESADGTVLAYQAGGLWRKSGEAVFIESEPSLAYNGKDLTLGLVDLQNLDSISKGERIEVRRNTKSKKAERLQKYLSDYWTDRFNSRLIPNVHIKVRITSKYAEGWLKYAQNRMEKTPNIDKLPSKPNQILLEFKDIGGTYPSTGTNPTFGTGKKKDHIIYSGTPDLAYKWENDKVGKIKPDDPTTGPLKPKVAKIKAGSGGYKVPSNDEYELALYTKNGRWVIYEPEKDKWLDADRNPVNPSKIKAIEHTWTPGSGNGVKQRDQFKIKPPRMMGGTVAPICIVKDTSGTLDIRKYLLQNGKGCLEKMIKVDESRVDPISPSPPINVDGITKQNGFDGTYYVGEKLGIETTVKNEGIVKGSSPVGVYFVQKHKYAKSGSLSKAATLVAGKNAKNVGTIDPGKTQTLNFDKGTSRQLKITPDMLGKKDKGKWGIVVATNDDKKFLKDGGNKFFIDVKKPNVKFALYRQAEDDKGEDKWNTNQDWNEVVERKNGVHDNTVKPGDKITFKAAVNASETGPSKSTQLIRLNNNIRIIDQKQKTINPGGQKIVEFEWTVRKKGPTTRDLTIQTIHDEVTKTFTVDKTTKDDSKFDPKKISVENKGEFVAGDQIKFNLDAKNTGKSAGTSLAKLSVKRIGSLSNTQNDPIPVDAAWVGQQGSSSKIQPNKNGIADLTWSTSTTDAGKYRVYGKVDGKKVSTTITLQDPADPKYTVDILEEESRLEVTEQENIQVYAEISVENPGAVNTNRLTQDVTIQNFDGGPVNVSEVVLTKDENDGTGKYSNVTVLSWQTFIGDSQDKTWEREDENDDEDAFTGPVTVAAGENTESQDTAEATINKKQIKRDPLDVMFVLDASGSMEGASSPSIHTFDTDTSGKPPYNLYEKGHLFLGSKLSQVSGITKYQGNYIWSDKRYKIFYTSDNPDSLTAQWTMATNGRTKIRGYRTYIVYEKTHVYFGKDLSQLDGIKKKTDDYGNTYYQYDPTQYVIEYTTNKNPNGPYAVWSEDDVENYNTDEIVYAKEEGERRTFAVRRLLEPQDPDEVRVSATADFVKKMQQANIEDDQAGVVYFSTDGSSFGNIDLTEDLADVRTSIQGYSDGGTNIGQGMIRGLYQLSENGQNQNQYMILLTDGFNNQAPDRDVLRQARKAKEMGVEIYTVGLGPAHNPPLMKEVANVTDGEYYSAQNADDLEEIFDDLQEDLSQPKLPSYTVTDVKADPKTVASGEEVEVSVTVRNDGKGAGQRPIVLKGPDGIPIDSKKPNGALDPGKKTTVTFNWDTDDAGVGTKELKAITASDAELNSAHKTTVTITEPETEFVVTQAKITNKNSSPYDPGTTITVEATIKNEGESGAAKVFLEDKSGSAVAVPKELEIKSDKKKTVKLEWTPLTPGTYDLSVTTEDGGKMGLPSITIKDPNAGGGGRVKVTGFKSWSGTKVNAGQKFTITANVKTMKTSKVKDAIFIMKVVDKDSGDPIKQIPVEKTITNKGTVTFKWKTGLTAVKDSPYKIKVVSANTKTWKKELKVVRKPPFDVRIKRQNPTDKIQEGEKVKFDVTVEKTADLPFNEVDIQLKYMGAKGGTGSGMVVNQIFNIGKMKNVGDTQTKTLTWQTWKGTAGNRKVKAKLAAWSTSDTQTVTIEKAQSDLQSPGRTVKGDNVNIDLDEIEVGS